MIGFNIPIPSTDQPNLRLLADQLTEYMNATNKLMAVMRTDVKAATEALSTMSALTEPIFEGLFMQLAPGLPAEIGLAICGVAALAAAAHAMVAVVAEAAGK